MRDRHQELGLACCGVSEGLYHLVDGIGEFLDLKL